ncbi:response regulator [Tautonia plasticadhaerens]|uniref:Alkaline phosphatase synthesis transcriptional regulatory protein PhoP n=1 Tax=Tautonia plasticadhaerens TaxID=2527974 RepID=A0A518H193_9BACT|nr:response regulator [Tautonia plasticadhaerens]QDV34588.1 Alkaline phosphatase synthesis transcriptional regulatory protein PhoP [Tautonia plasticadhaerens]
MPTDRDGTLLLVEDEDLLRGLVSQFLRISGFAVVEAADGREALRRIEEDGPFDLALVDLNLPHCSGVDVCRRLLGRWPGHRVIICSAAIVGENEAALRGLGIDHYLTKPYHPENLLQQVSRRLSAVA